MRGSRTLPLRAAAFKRCTAALWLGLCCLILLAGGAGSPAQAESASPDSWARVFALIEQNRWTDARAILRQVNDPLLTKAVIWKSLEHPDTSADFAELAGFVIENPDWPGLRALADKAETRLPADLSDREALNWFAVWPPRTTPGAIRHIDALRDAVSMARAVEELRRFYRTARLPGGEQADFIRRFSGSLGRADHEARLDFLLWEERLTAARQLLRHVSPGWRALAEARIALASQSPGVDGAVARVPAALTDHPGLIYERLRWRRRKDFTDRAIELIPDTGPVTGNAEAWWLERHILARRKLASGDPATAYRLAARSGQSEGLAMAEAEWLAGWIALRFLNDAEAATAHFERLYRTVSTPISRSRGAYWTGRALEARGETATARRWYEAAAVHRTSFYGQRAAERLGARATIVIPPDPVIDAASQRAFEGEEIVRLIRRFGAAGLTEEARPFLRHLASAADTAARKSQIARLALEIGAADMAVWTAKRAVRENITTLRAGWPILSVELPRQPEPALTWSVVRQESLFDLDARSSAGARGLMQLMPATAHGVARDLGIRTSTSRLDNDPRHNIRLGAAYLQELIDRYDGSYVLALAGYNAGPGRVSGWLRQNGDPRTAAVDVIDWIELIPIAETRNYVQRVLESVPVYRAQLGERAVFPVIN